jgi:hypothetical protein
MLEKLRETVPEINRAPPGQPRHRDRSQGADEDADKDSESPTLALVARDKDGSPAKWTQQDFVS